MKRSKTACLCDRPLRRMLLLTPAVVTVLICLWSAYTAVLPFSSDVSKACANEVNDAAVACDDNGESQQALTFAIANEKSEMRLLPNLPHLRLQKPSTLVPSKPFLSANVDSSTAGNDDWQVDGTLLSNPSAVVIASTPEAARATIASNAPLDSLSEHQPDQQDEERKDAVKEVVKIMGNLRRFVVRPRYTGNELSLAAYHPADSNSCDGKHIFIYDLPTKFNVDLLAGCHDLIPWQNMCGFFSNSGMGTLTEDDPSSSKGGQNILVPPGLWYQTHQYALEIIFHERLKHYKCLTASADLADMFYIPYYGGVDVLRWHFVQNATTAQRDELGLELINWLKQQPSWMKHEGADHVLVLGKITWDFRRTEQKMWGSNLLLQGEMQNLTTLLIERNPWSEQEVAVPHPTFFHPRHDRDIRTWQSHIEGHRRTYLVSFAGLPRPNQSESIRSQLIKQCLSAADDIEPSLGSSSCHFLNCGNLRCFQPHSTMDLFIHSEFCLQPPGDSPTRRSVFDSLIAGCIPVLFDPYSAYYQYPWHLPADPKAFSVYFAADDVREGKTNVIDELRKIPSSVRQEMRRQIIYEIMPGLVYARPDARLRDTEDAFILSLRGLFGKISDRLSRVEEQKR